MRIRHWRWAVLAQFCYVGAQTACWSYLIRYAIEEIPGMTAGFAANYLTATMVCFFIGRFTGTWLIRRFAPHNVLAIYAFIAMLLCLLSAFSGVSRRSAGPDPVQRLYVHSVPDHLLAGD